jgi:hypothetical protein
MTVARKSIVGSNAKSEIYGVLILIEAKVGDAKIVNNNWRIMHHGPHILGKWIVENSSSMVSLISERLESKGCNFY